MRICSKCKIEKELFNFYKNQYHCKDCQRIMWRERRKNNKTLYDGKKKEEIQKRLSILNKQKATLGCSICKENDFRCLDFHHQDNNKVANIAYLVSSGYAWQSVLDEVAKCIVICANCHRKHHYKSTLPSE